MNLKKPGILFLFLCGCLSSNAQTEGSLDSSFGTNGMVFTPIGLTLDRANSVVQQPDGKLLLGGSYINDTTGNYDFVIARYHPSGAIDSSFGANGFLRQPVGPGNDGLGSIVLQPDGKIRAAGTAYNYIGNIQSVWVTARYTSNGQPDNSYGVNGMTLTDFGVNAVAHAAVLQPDGRMVVVGDATNDPPVDIAVARYLPDGTPDSSFALYGRFVADFSNGQFDNAYCVLIQPDGKVLVGGSSARPVTGAGDFFILRMHTDGSIDSSFGIDGAARASMGGYGDALYSMALQPDGKILATGSTLPNNNGEMALARFNADGSLDNGFGSGGKVVAPGNIGTDDANAVLLLSDGKILVAGCAENLPASYNRRAVLLRYTSNGAPDNSFGTGGKLITPVPNTVTVTCMLRQADDNIVVGGFSTNTVSQDDFWMARYRMKNPTGITALSAGGSGLQVYPNPVDRSTVIDTRGVGVGTGASWQLTGPDGRVLLRGELQPETVHPVHMERLPAGMYLLHTFNNTRSATYKLEKL